MVPMITHVLVRHHMYVGVKQCIDALLEKHIGIQQCLSVYKTSTHGNTSRNTQGCTWTSLHLALLVEQCTFMEYSTTQWRLCNNRLLLLQHKVMCLYHEADRRTSATLT